MDYLYDGSFTGLLCCVYHHYYTEKAGGIYVRDSYQTSMLGGYLQVESDEARADRVYRAFEEKVSHYAMRCVYKAFLSAVPDKEMKILRFMVLGFRTGPGVTLMHGNDVFEDLYAAVRIVGTEKEKMCQFVRFAELEGGVMYGRIEPDHDVTELLWRHFTERFSFQPFIIHDVGRSKALVANGGDWFITDFTDEDLPEYSAREMGYQALWQDYFDNIAIKERINPGCQRNFVPMKYRKHLVEFRRTGQRNNGGEVWIQE